MRKVQVEQAELWINEVTAGEQILLSGTVYTARDAAHKRLFALLDEGKALPFDIGGSFIYFAGPTPAPKGMAVGSCGPTTSSRMDVYTPRLHCLGLKATIGKGDRSEQVYEAIVKNKALYLCAVGGAGALAASCITQCEVIAFDDLGCESIKRMQIKDFPLFVGIDCNGNSIFPKGERK